MNIPTIPSNLENRSHDFVSYTVTVTNTFNPDKKLSQEFLRAPCYSSHMSCLPTTEFLLYPIKGDSPLPFEIFERWISLCKMNGLVPDEAEVSRGKTGNTLRIPATGRSKHVVYSALCCYRWSENQPGTPYLTVKLLDERPKLDFFQAFHYAAAQRIYSSIHSFTTILTTTEQTKTIYQQGIIKTLNLEQSLCLAWFFRKDKNGVVQAEAASNPQNTLNAITKHSYNVLPVVLPLLKSNALVLREEFTPFYQNVIDNSYKESIVTTIHKVCES